MKVAPVIAFFPNGQTTLPLLLSPSMAFFKGLSVDLVLPEVMLDAGESPPLVDPEDSEQLVEDDNGPKPTPDVFVLDDGETDTMLT